MKKSIILVVFVAIFTMLLVFSSKQMAFAAFEFADGRIYITGWAENLTSLRLDKGFDDGINRPYKEGDIQTFRNTLSTPFYGIPKGGVGGEEGSNIRGAF